MCDSISSLINWKEHGFDLCEVCSNGHDLVEAAEREQPDLVILDINMPYIDGITAAKLIKEDVPHAKIAFLTGYDSFSYAQKAVDLNALKYILKPISAAKMIGILSEIRSLIDDEMRKKADYQYLQDFHNQHSDIMKSAFFNRLHVSNLISAIKSGDLDQINSITKQMLQPDQADSISTLRAYALSIILSIALEAERLGFSASSFLSGTMIDALFQRRSTDELCSDVRDACSTLSKILRGQHDSGQLSLFERTVRFIEENISDTELSAITICGKLYFSPSYFRAIFKKESGVSFGSYLTRARMEKAKALLLETDQKSYHIAKQVGFSDPHYFSFCFKKHYGMSPKEFRGTTRSLQL